MLIERVWAMPNSNTFEIEPIRDLLRQELTDGLWIDPYANKSKLATITNDLNPEYDTDYHMDALDFLKMFEDRSVDGILFDPPYSMTQVKQCYNGFGFEMTSHKAHYFYADQRVEMERIIKIGGKIIWFGWSTNGVGLNLGFEMTRILLVPHGGIHNDTICTVEVKKFGRVESNKFF